jgi:membrane-bound metal-dependent hydrolase YbcI (DUF457 family)
MKGVTHYLCALAVTAAIPGNIEQAAAGAPWPILIGGMGGLLPDFLDFKIWRFLAPRAACIVPDPLDPDAAMVCDGFVNIMQLTLIDGRKRVVKLQTIPTGATTFIPYKIRVLPAEQLLSVTISLPDDERSATKALPADTRFDYLDTIHVDQGDGPTIGITRTAGHRLGLSFLPWHRSWSHSCVLAAGMALLVGLLLGSRFGVALALGWGSHILLDQCGNMGCNLFWPFSRQRRAGFGVSASDSLTGNGVVAWSSIMLILATASAARYRSPLTAPQLMRLWLVPLGIIALPRLVAAVRLRLRR